MTNDAISIVEETLEKNISLDEVAVMGDAKGVDKIAAGWCERNGRHFGVFKALWDYYGKAAGTKRNESFTKISYRLVAMWDGRTHGTGDAIMQALGYALPVFVYNIDGKEWLIDPAVSRMEQLAVIDDICRSSPPVGSITENYTRYLLKRKR